MYYGMYSKGPIVFPVIKLWGRVDSVLDPWPYPEVEMLSPSALWMAPYFPWSLAIWLQLWVYLLNFYKTKKHKLLVSFYLIFLPPRSCYDNIKYSKWIILTFLMCRIICHFRGGHFKLIVELMFKSKANWFEYTVVQLNSEVLHNFDFYSTTQYVYMISDLYNDDRLTAR